jgi:parvulin-like peptidyl-prolyl isomerase
MPNLFHKYQQPIWIVLTLVIIASFVLFWNGSMISHGVLGGSQRVGSIYGRPITDTDFIQEAHKYQIAMALQMNGLVQPLVGAAQSQDEALQNFVFNSYVFNHEADELQIYPTDAEMQDALAQIPGFQTDGRFDPAKLTEFVQERLPPLGFTDSVLDELVREQVRIRRVTQLIGATVDISPAELNNRYLAENETMDLSIIRLNTSDLEKSIPVSDPDALKEYNAHKETYVSPEMRKVSVASFELSDAQTALKGRDRTDALQKLGGEAWDFAQAVVDKSANFADQAKKFGVPLTSSAFFSQDQPDPALASITDLAPTTFKLSADYPSSDVVEGKNGYYVLHLEGTVPSRQLSFDEAKPQVIAEIQKQRAGQLMQTKANDVRNQIAAALAAGKSITDAAAAAGVKAETIPPFSLGTASKLDVPDLQTVIQTAVTLAKGQLSDFQSNETGGFMLYMDNRVPVDPETAKFAEMMERDQFSGQKRVAAFLEWLRLRREAARLQLFQRSA